MKITSLVDQFARQLLMLYAEQLLIKQKSETVEAVEAVKDFEDY